MRVQYILAALSLLFLSNSALTDPPDDFPLCDPFPIPIESTGPVLQFDLSNKGENFTLVTWRYPCDGSYSYVVLTVLPEAESSPKICSTDLTLIQNDQESQGYVLTQGPLNDFTGFCGEVDADTSFALLPTQTVPTIRLQESFDINWDLVDDDFRFTMFAFDAGDYNDDDFPTDPGLTNDAGLNGMFYDPEKQGHGFEVSVNEAGLIIYYFGHTSKGEQLWLISDRYEENLEFATEIPLLMYRVEGTYGEPSMPSIEWGTLEILFSDCDNGAARLDGEDGVLQIDFQRLVGLEGVNCK